MIRQEIWEEMKKAKTYQLSCLYYVNKKRKFNRNYNLCIIGVSAIGAPTFFLSHWCALITTIAASILEVIKSFIPAVCQSEEELSKLDGLSVYFGETLQKLEKLWNDHESSEESNQLSLSKELTKILKFSPEKETSMNKLIHSLSKEEDDNIREQADNYFVQKFYEQQYIYSKGSCHEHSTKGRTSESPDNNE